MWSGRSDFMSISMHPASTALTCVFPYLDDLSEHRSHFNVRISMGPVSAGFLRYAHIPFDVNRLCFTFALIFDDT